MSEPVAQAPEIATLSPLTKLLRCLECGGTVEVESLDVPKSRRDLGPDGRLRCGSCGAAYPLRAGTPRMLRGSEGAEAEVKDRTAESFAYEWERFGVMRPEWRKNFLDYMQPHPPEFFDGITMLDVGTGSGRHSYWASELGAQVVAADLGASIDVARRNLPERALTVQADAEALPFEHGTFDLVSSIGVLHHTPNPERTFRAIVPFSKPGGWVQIYLYWLPPHRWHRAILRIVTAARRVTTRMPHRLLHTLCYPLAALLMVVFVAPYRLIRGVPGLHRVAALIPLKTYADYPFGVLVNDQFDRFSAPLERRYTREEVEGWLTRAGLKEITVLPNHGWVASGRVPVDEKKE